MIKNGNACTCKMFKKWKFGTINIRSGKEKDEGAKIYSVTKEVAKAGLALCCLQEVKYRNSGSRLIELDSGEKYEFHWCGMKKRRTAGVGFLIKVDKDITIADPDVNDPRVIAANLTLYGFKVRIINAYSPTESDCSESKKDDFYRLLKKACVNKDKNRKLIVAGDFNAKTDIALRKCDYDGQIIIPDENCNANGTRMKDFCRNNKLCITSSFFDYPLINRYTWYSTDGITMRVNDYVLTERFVQDFVTDCKAEPGLDFDSDHRIMITSLHTPMTRKARWKPIQLPKKPQPDINALRNPVIADSFLKSIENQLATETIVTPDKIINVLKTAGETSLPRVTRKKKVNEVWKEDKVFNDLLNERRKNNIGSQEYKSYTKKIKPRIRFLRNEKLKREAVEINDNASRRQIEELYRRLKTDSMSFKNLRDKQKCDPVKLKEHFIAHFSENQVIANPSEIESIPEYIKQLQDIKADGLNALPPDLAELKSTIKSLKNGKSANDVPASYVKQAMKSDKFAHEMLKLYESVWTTNEVPKDWKQSKLVALWKGAKKGSKDDPSAYRGLQIGSTLCKILVIIIINRIKTWYENQLMDEQQGFRSGRGTSDGVYILKRIQEISNKMKKTVYALFVDLAAAFDHIIRDFMFNSILNRIPPHVNSKIIQLLQNLYNDTTTSLAETPDDCFELFIGVRQGGPESPILYNLYMDFVMRVFLKKCSENGVKFLNLKYNIPCTASKTNRVTIGHHEVKWIGYADDLVLFFESAADMRKAANILCETFGRYGLEINKSKTNTMILNHHLVSQQYPETIISIENTHIENVKVFKYLGCNIKYDEPSTGNSELEFRIDTAHNKFYELGKKMMNHRIHLPTRVTFLNALVRARLTYSCQTWNLSQVQVDRINSSYLSMLRKMVKGGYRRVDGTFRFVLSNRDLLRKCQTESIQDFISRQQRNFVAHITRSENDRLLKRLMFNGNEIRRPGRRRTLYGMVLERMMLTSDQFNRDALLRRY